MIDNEKIIGKVIKVNSSTVTIELMDDLSNLTKNSFYGVEYIGKINSFVIIRSATSKIIAQVTSISLDEEISSQKNLRFRSSKKILYAELIGEIRGRADKRYEFEYGVTNYPLLASPVEFISEEELDVVFGIKEDPTKGKFATKVGKSAVFDKYDVKIDSNIFFGKHAAILGNTGSGKSCTIASIIQSIFSDPNVVNGHFIIFDTNGEYKKALFEENPNDILNRINALYVSTEEATRTLKIPHWLLSMQEYKDLFNPAEQNQLPVLIRALSIAKLLDRDVGTGGLAYFHTYLYYSFLLIQQLFTEPPSANIGHALTKSIGISVKIESVLKQYSAQIDGELLKEATALVAKIKPLKLEYGQLKDHENIIQACSEFTEKYRPESEQLYNVDKPLFFNFEELINRYLPLAQLVDENEGNSKVREYCSTMFLRIKGLFNNADYDFLFKNEHFDQALAIFLRFITGMLVQRPNISSENHHFKKALDDISVVKDKTRMSQVVIIDLSSLNSDVVENITAILGRLILDFLQQPLFKRGSLPICLVLEEAHRYIPENKSSPAKHVFERIAKEGRKFGLGLVVSSQRPSELSRTVLSQCNSFIVHKIQNPEDLSHVEKMTPYINRDVFRQLPVIPRQYALVFGECVKFPILFKVRNADPKPKSDDGEYSTHWLNPTPDYPNFEEICARWELNNKKITDDSSATVQSDTEITPSEPAIELPDIYYSSDVKVEDLPF